MAEIDIRMWVIDRLPGVEVFDRDPVDGCE
jgi:hypothetical protein